MKYSTYSCLRALITLTLVCDLQTAVADPELLTSLTSPAPRNGAFFGFAVACPASTKALSAGSDIVCGEVAAGPNLQGRTTVHRGSDGTLLYNELDPTSLSELGFSVAAIGDADKNGFDDFIEGARGTSRASIVMGPGNSPLDLATGFGVGDLAGAAVAGLFADTNSNSHSDVLVGAPLFNGLAGNFSGGVAIVDTSTLAVSGNQLIEGLVGGEQLGSAVISTSDLDGDGVRDIIAGAPELGSSGGIRILSSAQMPIYISELLSNGVVGERFGASLAPVPDLTGDGIEEFLVGACGQEGTIGRAELYSGGVNPIRLCSLAGESPNDLFGYSLAGLGDIDGNGSSDFAVGAPRALNGDGKVYIYKYDSVSGVCTQIFALAGAPDQGFGSSLAGFAGGTLNCDFDSDGRSDFIVGSEDNGASIDEGKVFAYRNVTPTPTVTPTSTSTPPPTATATPSATPTAVVVLPSAARLNYTISTAGTLSANVTLNVAPPTSSSCQIKLLGRRSDFDLTNRGSIQTLIPSQPIVTQDVRYLARGLRKPSAIGCDVPYIFHMLAVVDCGAGEFFSNMRARYLTCGRQPEQSISAWEQSLLASITVSTESAKRPVRRKAVVSKIQKRPCRKRSG